VAIGESALEVLEAVRGLGNPELASLGLLSVLSLMFRGGLMRQEHPQRLGLHFPVGFSILE
jgi:hypothetical protein